MARMYFDANGGTRTQGYLSASSQTDGTGTYTMTYGTGSSGSTPTGTFSNWYADVGTTTVIRFPGKKAASDTLTGEPLVRPLGCLCHLTWTLVL